MGVIPQSVIDGWYRQYDDSAPLWAAHAGIGVEQAAHIRALAERDRPILRQICFQDARPAAERRPVYVATAGGPLAGKSTILDQHMNANPVRYGNAVKVDPDRWGMLFMAHTYHAYLMSAGMIAHAADFETAQRRAYDIARPASNYLTLEILNAAVEGRFDIAHGTTMTSPHIGGLLNGLKANGYEIDLLLCGAEDDMRADAQIYRANVQGYYQSTPDDVRTKGMGFAERMADYFTLSDNLTLFWRNGVTENAIKAASYTQGVKTVLDETAFDRFVQKYESDRYTLAHPAQGPSVILPAFAAGEQAYLSRPAALPSPGGSGGIEPAPQP